MKVRDILNVHKEVMNTPLGHSAKPIGELIVVDGRDWHVVGTPTLKRDCPRKAKDDAQPEYVDIWYGQLQNGDDDSTLFTAFQEGSQGRQVDWPAGPLDTTVCPDSASCSLVLNELANLMNRVPVDFDVKALVASTVQTYYFGLKYLESLALRALHPQGLCDYSLLSNFFTSSNHGRHNLNISVYTQGKSKTQLECVLNCVTKGSTSTVVKKQFSYTASLSITKMDLSKRGEIRTPPASFPFVASYVVRAGKPVHAMRSDPRFDMVLELFTMANFEMLGYAASEVMLDRHFASLVEYFETGVAPAPASVYAGTQGSRINHKGVLNNKPAMRNLSSANVLRIEWAAETLNCVEHLELIPPPMLRTNSLVMISYVYECFQKAFTGGAGSQKVRLLNAIQAAYVAADMVTLGRVSREEVLASHCLCNSAAERHLFEHFCMRCIELSNCTELVRAEDGRYFCPLCEADPARGLFAVDENFHINRLKGRLQFNLKTLLKGEAKAQGATDGSYDTTLYDKMLEKLLTFVDFEAGTWQDGYNGTRRFEDATYSQAVTNKWSRKVGNQFQNPLAMSIEMPSRFVVVDGKAYYHHFSEDLVIPFSVNILKATHSAGVLPWLGLAMKHTLDEVQGQGRDEVFWSKFYDATDHCYIIDSCLSTHLKSRLRAVEAMSDSEQKNMRCMLRNVTWDFKTLPNAAGLFSTKATNTRPLSSTPLGKLAEAQLPPGKTIDRAPYKQPSSSELKDLLTFAEECRTDATLNPNNLTIPDVHGWPHPWQEKSAFKSDTKEQYLDWACRFYYRTLCTMDEECDPRVLHDETILKMWGLHIVQWYQHGGGMDPLLKSEIVPFSGHMRKSSVGRDPKVPAGSPMNLGFKGNPKHLADFSDNDRTAQVELWIMNLYKYDYPTFGKLDQTGRLQEILMSLSEQTEHYEPADLSVVRRAIPFPRNSTRLIAGRTGLQRGNDIVYEADLTQLVAGAPVSAPLPDAQMATRIEEAEDEEMKSLEEKVGIDEQGPMDEYDDVTKSLSRGGLALAAVGSASAN